MSDAYGAARELLERAERDAERIRADADRYRRQREQEAELLVAKARRLLAVAEQKAASLVAVQRAQLVALDGRPAADAGSPPSDVPAVVATGPVVDLAVYERSRLDGEAPMIPTGLDRMLKSAIAKAVDRSFHLGT